jgi:hypothetical protein
MSMMTDIQGTPERVWSLVSLVDAHGGEITRHVVKSWLDPFDTDPKGTALDDTIGAATSLEILATDSSSKTITLQLKELPRNMEGFADWVHGRLTQVPADHGDSVVLEVLAWFVARSAKEKGTTWIAGYSTQALCDQIRHDIRVGSDDKRFNPTRYPRWRDWVGFIGLGVEVPRGASSPFYPYVTERLEKVVGKLAPQLSVNSNIEAGEFLAAVAKEMPYVDGGRLFRNALERVGTTSQPRQLSPVLSVALRELDEEGVIKLRMHGDARDAFLLTHDPTHKLQAFREVIIKGRHD